MWLRLLAILLITATLIQAAIEKLPESYMTLFGEPELYKRLVERLDDALPNVRVSDVIEDTNHKTDTYPLDPRWFYGFTWEKRRGYNDQDTYRWVPQGITTSQDAYHNGTYEDNDIFLVSWYDNTTEKASDPRNKGVRISFIDATPSNMNLWTYRNVLLVVPEETESGEISYYPVRIHAGGIMWYGHLLYVVDTENGIRIFDMRHIYRVNIGARIGRGRGGRYTAALYKYIIPQMGLYRLNSTTVPDFRFSFISLDRTSRPDSFIVGEYDSTGKQNRIARFELNYRTRLPVPGTGDIVVATQFYNIGLKSMQGALSITREYEGADPRYHFTCSKGDGPDAQGDLWTWTVGKGKLDVQEGVLSRGPEDMTYRQHGGEIWTLGELSRERPIYSFSTGSIP